MSVANRPAHLIRIRRASLMFVAVSCLGLLLAPATRATIFPQRGIDGIDLKMTRAQVIYAKGKPDAEKVISHEIIGKARTMRYGATRVTFDGTGPQAGAIGVLTKDRGQHTRSGVGVGSSAAEVRAEVQGTQCRTEFGFSHCWKGSFLPGKRVTDFRLNEPEGKVVSVSVGFVID